MCPVCHYSYNVASKNHILSDRELTDALYAASRRERTLLDRGALRDAKHIIWRESTNDVLCRTRKSSSFGLAGFLDSTWRSTRIAKTRCPVCQLRAFLRYVHARFGTVSRAYAFHRRHGYY